MIPKMGMDFLSIQMDRVNNLIYIIDIEGIWVSGTLEGLAILT